MRRLKEGDLTRLAGQLETLAKILRADPNCRCGHKLKGEHAYHVARCAYGAPGSGSGNRGSKGDHSDPTFRQATSEHPDESDTWLEDLSMHAESVSASVQNLARLVHDLGTITATSPRELTATGSGDCMACGRFCSGSATDRLVAGMCDTDYRRWCRHGRPDRFEFCRDTPAYDAPNTEVAS